MLASFAWMMVTGACAAADIETSTIVRFNTVCARCHEGQCSGRLSFDRQHANAVNHIRRHGGEVSPQESEALFVLLGEMKERCAYRPLPPLPAVAGGWTREHLAPLQSPAGDAHFIPLGVLPAGRYRAALHFADPAEACGQIVSARFDIVDYPGISAPDGHATIEFESEEKVMHYLRLQTGKPVALERLELKELRK
jgi:hypothetical protein